MSVLEVSDLIMRFGGVVAMNNVNLRADKGEIVAIIGPNGAGKTTTFNVITGVYKPTEGKVTFCPDPSKPAIDITGSRPDIIAKMGICRTFQNIRLFKDQNVLENVMVANHVNLRSNLFTATLGLPQYRKEEKEIRERSMALLERVELAQYANASVSSLPYGLQRKLEIARALATDPKVLLLDEPAAGMNPKETEELTHFVVKIKNDFDLTVLMIEHHMQIVMDISDRIYVLDFGKMIADGTPEEISNNQKVIDAYLGVDEDAEGE